MSLLTLNLVGLCVKFADDSVSDWWCVPCRQNVVDYDEYGLDVKGRGPPRIVIMHASQILGSPSWARVVWMGAP
jgi:hypothetical protein